jgi:exosortase
MMTKDFWFMTPVVESAPRTHLPWKHLAWFGMLMLACYAPILRALVRQWDADPDMSHGFFVPLVAGFIVWQKRAELLAMKPEPNWWGLALVVYGGFQLLLGALAVELFLTRTAILFTLIGAVWFMGGDRILKKLAFPLFLCFFMIPIPGIIYNNITFPLQITASRFAEHALSALAVPVLREGNVLVLPEQELSVVEACSGIRSLLSLTFLSLIYGYFFERRMWLRVVLFFATIPIAIVANASRVTLTGILTQIKPELAEGFFHTASGWVIFMVALFILVFTHQVISRAAAAMERRRAHASAH